MTKYQLIVLALLISSILTAVFGMGGTNKGAMSMLYKLFGAITLILVLLISYRAFFLIR